MEGEGCGPHPLRVLRVLIVDDSPGFRLAARELLSRRGYAVVGEAECRASALDAVARLRPDAVLLDVNLGADSGFDVARALRDESATLTILLVSSVDYACDVPRSAGASGFLPKARLATMDLSAYLGVG
jgi:DNA-binding NarL/FixJ family response regulator